MLIELCKNLPFLSHWTVRCVLTWAVVHQWVCFLSFILQLKVMSFHSPKKLFPIFHWNFVVDGINWERSVLITSCNSVINPYTRDNTSRTLALTRTSD